MSAPEDVQRLAGDRADARAAKDFALADELRDRIHELGWEVTDQPGGFELEPVASEADRPVRSADVPSVLDDTTTFDVSVHWVCEGWLDDIDRALAGFRATAGDRRVQFVVADVTGEAPKHWADAGDVEVVWLESDTGWAAARNAGLRRSLAPIVVALDGSVEPIGDVLGPLEQALADPGLGIVGPFGIVTEDLREFQEAPEAGPCDAVEGYLMAFR